MALPPIPSIDVAAHLQGGTSRSGFGSISTGDFNPTFTSGGGLTKSIDAVTGNPLALSFVIVGAIALTFLLTRR